MKTLTIVKDLDVLKDISFRLPSRTVASMMNQILLERSKEAFHRGVVVDIARTAHAGQRFMGGQKMLVASAGILAAAVGMVKQTGQRLAVRDGHFESLGGQGVRSERQIENLSAQKEDMTLEDMLTMRSGLDWSDTGDYPAMEKSTDWVQFVLDKPMAEEPGNAWNYCSECSHVLSAIIQQSTGMNTRDFADEYLFNPLGISDIFWFTDGAGIPDGGSRLQLAPRDMAKLGYLYLREGQWDGQQIVPAEWVKTTTLRHVALDEHFSYGYHWFTVYSLEGFAVLGSQGQIILVIPEYDMVVVTTAFTQESILELVEQYIVPAVEK
jgi:hypothetical protein